MALPPPIGSKTAAATNPKDNTPLGIAINTAKGIPTAFNVVGKKIVDTLVPALPPLIQGLTTGDFTAYKEKLASTPSPFPNIHDTSPEGQRKQIDAVLGFVNPEGGAAKEVAPLIKDAMKKVGPELLSQAKMFVEGITKSGKEAPADIFKGIKAGLESVGVKLPETQAEAARVLSEALPHVVPEPATIPHPDFHLPEISSQAEPSLIESSIQKLTQALAEAKPVRAAQEKLYSAERSKRLGAALGAQSPTGGEAGFAVEKAQLAGELPKAQFESLRGKLAQEDIDNLFNAVVQSTRLGAFDKIQARTGLQKMFGPEGGSVPTNKELSLLAQVFPPETIKALVDARPILSKIGSGIIEALNLPRSIQSTFDLSAPLRQGLFLIGKPKEFAGAFLSMFKQFGSEKAFKAVEDSIRSRPTYQLMRDAKLAITDMDGLVTNREEQFMSNWVEKIPVIGRGARASGRAYTGFLNKLRADVFDSMLAKAKDLGVNNPELPASLAQFINAASGRGSLGALERAAPLLNGIFFSPRLMASRINMLNPAFYVKLDPFVRKEALKTMLSSGSIILTVLGLAKMGGASVETNPTNADWLKAKVGNTRFDVAGGLQQYLRLAAQLVTGHITSSTTGKVLTLGEGYKPLTRLDIIERFFMGKENPIASFVTDFLQGQNAVGEKFELSKELLDRFIPLIAQDLEGAIKEWGPIGGAAVTLPAVFGVGVQTYGDKKGKLPAPIGGGKLKTTSSKLPNPL